MRSRKYFRNLPFQRLRYLHPDRYFNNIAFPDPELPKPMHHAKPFVTGALGELDHRVLLQQYIDAAFAGSLATPRP